MLVNHKTTDIIKQGDIPKVLLKYPLSQLSALWFPVLPPVNPRSLSAFGKGIDRLFPSIYILDTFQTALLGSVQTSCLSVFAIGSIIRVPSRALWRIVGMPINRAFPLFFCFYQLNQFESSLNHSVSSAYKAPDIREYVSLSVSGLYIQDSVVDKLACPNCSLIASKGTPLALRLEAYVFHIL